jgi:hypothetical protein
MVVYILDSQNLRSIISKKLLYIVRIVVIVLICYQGRAYHIGSAYFSTMIIFFN